jgi:hypothetical protein
MPSRSALARMLADRLDRLRATFAALNQAVREKVAEVVGKTAEDLVRHAVRAALDRAQLGPAPRPAPAWWADDDRDVHDQDVDEYDADWRPVAAEPPPQPRLAAAVLAGCKAAAWWLRRAPLTRPWVLTVAGLATGAVVYACPPLAAALLPAAAALALAEGATALALIWPD